MSFLGLSDSTPSGGSDYLLEDEEESRPWGKILLLVLLLGIGGGLAWQWQHGGYPWNRMQPSVAAPNPSMTAPAPSPAENPAPATPTPAPPAAPVAEPPNAVTASAPAPTEPEPSQVAPATEKAPVTPPAESAPEKSAEEPETSVAPPVTKKPVKAAVAHPKPAPPPEPAVSAGEALFAQGQKYLYGKGAEENCALALRSFQAAADRDHVQAESTLGVMYFTGHCVNRDLPTAYRWFAKALHNDPSNLRLEQNLSSVWSQMTPEERQAATRSE
jgi:hypothetical protein